MSDKSKVRPPGTGRILVIRGGAIGDFVVTLPALAALRRQFPAARIELVAYTHVGRLAVLAGCVDQVHPIESRALAGFFARQGALDAKVSDLFAGSDVVFTYLYDPDQIFRTNILRVSGAQVIQGPHRPDEAVSRSAAEQFLAPMEGLGIFDADPVPRIPLDAAVPRHPRRIAVHPGSGSPSKNWPVSSWRTLVESWLAVPGIEVLLVGGEAENEAIGTLRHQVPSPRIRVLHGLPLDDLARQLAGCSGFVGHDSGITHLAAAVGTPTVVLWGPTVEAVWRPGGRHVRVVRHPDALIRLEAATVATAVREHFGMG